MADWRKKTLCDFAAPHHAPGIWRELGGQQCSGAVMFWLHLLLLGHVPNAVPFSGGLKGLVMLVLCCLSCHPLPRCLFLAKDFSPSFPFLGFEGKVVAVLPPKKRAAAMCSFHRVMGRNGIWLSEHLRNYCRQAKRGKFMKEYIWFLDGWIPERFILPFFPAIYPLGFYTPIFASSKPPSTKCPFLLMSPKPVTVHTALPHLFFPSATGP